MKESCRSTRFQCTTISFQIDPDLLRDRKVGNKDLSFDSRAVRFIYRVVVVNFLVNGTNIHDVNSAFSGNNSRFYPINGWSQKIVSFQNLRYKGFK